VKTNNDQLAGIAHDAVTAWIVDHVEGVRAPLDFTLIAGGHSNLTYRFVDAAGRAGVLRRPPLGHVLESAHDMSREHRIVSALQGSAVPVAKTLGLCEDVLVNQAPFYLMDFVDGAVLHDADAARTLSEADRNALGEHVIEVLGALHRINPDDVGLGELGRKEGYLARQLKRWIKQWEATKTHEIPEMDEVIRLLSTGQPEQIGATIVHGDYRLGNFIVGDRRVRAVLDWELCTLGDPLADVGYLLNSWVEPEDNGTGMTPVEAGGFPTREQLCERYQASTGRDLSQINYYRAFSHWRLAAIGQGVYKRYLVGAMGDNTVDLDAHKEGVQLRAQAALALLT
jgi:aminoglycoside phosphotransferase (APT) family kinase protein